MARFSPKSHKPLTDEGVVSGPFLELAFYVGEPNVPVTIRALVDHSPDDHIPKKLRSPGIVGLRRKEKEEIEIYGGIVVLRADGSPFSGPSGARLPHAKTSGLRVYKRFVELADSIPCAYGAVLGEYSLEDPGELRRTRVSYAFRNFFLSEDRLGASVVKKAVACAGENAYVQNLRHGVYVSMWEYFNPDAKGLDPVDAEKRSVQIAKVIADATI